MPSAGFEPTIPAGERPQTYAEVVYAVVPLFRIRIHAIGLPDRDAYCVIGDIKILSLCCRHHAVIK